VVHGLDGTGKLEVISTVLEARNIGHTLVRSRECLSQRHLLGKIFTSCMNALEQQESIEEYDRVDSLNALSVGLQRLFRKLPRKLVVVLDAIDEVKGAGSTMLPALARLGDMVRATSREKHAGLTMK
jgi:origin recognition complex subunit 5